MTFPVVTTSRLVLRPFRAEDLDALHDIQRREDVTRYLLWDARSREETRAGLAQRLAQTELEKEGDNLAIAIEHRETGALLGDFNLSWQSAELGRAEIGFVMHPDHHGHGYATEAGREVLRMGFVTYGFHRVVGLCNGDNSASMGLMERLGMRREAYFVEGEMLKGKRADLAVYAMLRSEWPDGV